jgi:hypothetical protein
MYNTFEGWKKLGFSVVRGSRCVGHISPAHEETGMGHGQVALFHKSQTTPIRTSNPGYRFIHQTLDAISKLAQSADVKMAALRMKAEHEDLELDDDEMDDLIADSLSHRQEEDDFDGEDYYDLPGNPDDYGHSD